MNTIQQTGPAPDRRRGWARGVGRSWGGAIYWAVMAVSLTRAAEPIRPRERTALWPGVAPMGSGQPVGTNAFITVYPADPATANGTAVVICPGGGYGGLVTGAEGSGIAQWLNQHGIAGIVLEYRLPHGNSDIPLRDAQRALRTVRAQAAGWGIRPNQVGIAGFSAGGHLAATAATHFDLGIAQAADPVEQLSCRPDFALLVYPVITMGELTHGGTKANLLGTNPDAALVALYSNEKQVNAQTPPAFLTHALDDGAVSADNSRMFYDALRQHQVPAQYLELPSGGHGLNGYQGPMWDAWQQGSLNWLATLGFISPRDAWMGAAPSSVTFAAVSRGPQPVGVLPGQRGFVFSIYGAPGEADKLHQLVDVMRTEKLGNGFDPGPGPNQNTKPIFDTLAQVGWPVVFYSGGEMQIKGGRSVFGREQETALAAMDRAGIFTAYQIGEWGYYFHNLAPNEAWWHDVYGKEFDAFKHLMKPAGLAGYDRRPTTRRECYEVVHDYFASRQRDLLGRVISVTGHSHYEAYVGEWGAKCIGLEVGENIAFTQSKLAFARGGSRAWQKPWSVQVSPWFSGACTTSGPLRQEAGGARGLDAGHSLNFYERMWWHSWFAGAAMVTPENSIAIFFDRPESPWSLTAHGRKGAEFFQFTQSHDRGVPYMPVAVVLDRYAGYNGYMDKPWGILPPSTGDRELRDLFDQQLFPGSDHIHGTPDRVNPEASYLRPTPYGEMFDVVLSSAPAEVLPVYPVILLAGDLEFDHGFLGELEKALRRGSRVLMSARHRDALGAEYARLARQGIVEVLEPWTNPATGRSTAIGNERLARLVQEVVPVAITGDPVAYQLNRLPRGWVLELINNRGVVKTPSQPAVVDPTAVARVTVQLKLPCRIAREWRSGIVHELPVSLAVELPPGGSEYIELSDPEASP